jgi:hypothetical protein
VLSTFIIGYWYVAGSAREVGIPGILGVVFVQFFVYSYAARCCLGRQIVA